MEARDRDSTQDWLIPDGAPAAPSEPPAVAAERSAVAAEPPAGERQAPPQAPEPRPRKPEPPPPRAGNGSSKRPVQPPGDQREALRIAARAAEAAKDSAATALAAAEIADESSIRVKRAELHVEEVAQRADGVLSTIEGRERAARRRAREAAREDAALEAIAKRADRILENLRRLAA